MLIKNCRLIDMAGCWKEPRDVRIAGGKFAEIGSGLAAADGEEVLDAAGRIATPGFIDGHSMVGVKSQIHRFERSDANENSSPSTPQMRAIDALNICDEGFEMMRCGGVTTAVTGPGTESVIGGTFTAIKTGGGAFAQRIIQEEAAFHIVLASASRQVFGKRGKSPATRMGSAAIVREELFKAKLYREKCQSGSAPSFDIKYDSLQRVFDGMPVKFTAIAESDIRTAVRIGEEFGLRYTVELAFDALIMAGELKEHGVKCLIGPLYGGESSAETDQRRLENALALESSGLDYALMCGHPMLNGQLAPQYLALLHKYGMSERAALEGLTIRAARLTGLDGRVGSVEPGKDADLILWSGEPLDYYSHIDLLLIDGVPATAD